MRPFIDIALKLKEYGHRVRIASHKVRAGSRGTHAAMMEGAQGRVLDLQLISIMAGSNMTVFSMALTVHPRPNLLYGPDGASSPKPPAGVP